MSTRGILLLAGLFALAFVLLAAGKCGYAKIESIQTMENAIAQVRRDFPRVKPASTKTVELYQASSMTLLIVDARTEAEFAVSHLPGALHFTKVAEVAEAVDSMDKKPDTVLVYGALGFRSAEFAEKLQRGKVANVEHLEGGIFQWANEGLPLVEPAGEPTKVVHPYNKLWGRLLNENLRYEPEE
ncbi:MAG: rhodanese-like domain-containing protein [Verrucomicrobiales bacterium]|nr:rhodanese-like domain-containing protein [Verrucomicrobiales bacterium]